MAGRPSATRALDVWMNGELVGHWSFAPRTGHHFVYADSWHTNDLARPLSLSMPMLGSRNGYTGPVVESYFDNLLPDSLDIRRRLAARFAAASTGTFDLIEKIGRDCVGAVMLLPAGAVPPDVKTIQGEPQTERQVERLLDGTVALPAPGRLEEDGLRISIAGAQEKTALLWHDDQWWKPAGATPTTHILKLPLGLVGGMRADFSTSVENEWLCAQLANEFGLPVATCAILRFGRHKVLGVERFDRRRFPTWIARLPQEDFCQVLGRSPEEKYESRGGPGMSDILARLRGSEQARKDMRHFLEAQLFFWLLAAPDGHAKNFSIFLEPRGAYRMTPLYDILSAWPVIGRGAGKLQWQNVKMAMAVRSKNAHYAMHEIQRRHWNAVAKRNGIGQDFEESIQRFIDAASKAIDIVAHRLPKDFPASVSDAIFEGILRQIGALQRQT
jgi:serine/threonine-protein kinase HipA